MPYIGQDIVKKAKKITSEESSMKDRTEAKAWLRERHIKPKDALRLYEEALRAEYAKRNEGEQPWKYKNGNTTAFKQNLSRLKKRLGL